MSSAWSGGPETQGQPVRSRRWLLRGGMAVGLSMMAGAGLAARAQRPAAAAPYTLAATGRMILDYQPSQPTGWPAGMGQTVGVTVGGHVASSEFTYASAAYTVSLVPFGQTGASPNPVYEAVPADPDIAFQQTLDSAFAGYYTFRYVGGQPGWGQLSVQSYSTFVTEPSQTSPLLTVGAELYVVHIPGGHSSPVTQGNLRWIQVVNNGQARFVDHSGSANPFYIAAGLTSVYGRPVVSFGDAPSVSAGPGATGALPPLWTAETFLVEDTGVTDRSGKDILNVFGGLKYGWQIQEQ